MSCFYSSTLACCFASVHLGFSHLFCPHLHLLPHIEDCAQAFFTTEVHTNLPFFLRQGHTELFGLALDL